MLACLLPWCTQVAIPYSGQGSSFPFTQAWCPCSCWQWHCQVDWGEGHIAADGCLLQLRPYHPEAGPEDQRCSGSEVILYQPLNALEGFALCQNNVHHSSISSKLFKIYFFFIVLFFSTSLYSNYCAQPILTWHNVCFLYQHSFTIHALLVSTYWKRGFVINYPICLCKKKVGK